MPQLVGKSKPEVTMLVAQRTEKLAFELVSIFKTPRTLMRKNSGFNDPRAGGGEGVLNGAEKRLCFLPTSLSLLQSFLNTV